MAVDDIEAEHVTLALADAYPRQEIQLLKYRHPDPIPDPNITNLAKVGSNHICFAVEDIESEVERLDGGHVLWGEKVSAMSPERNILPTGHSINPFAFLKSDSHPVCF